MKERRMASRPYYRQREISGWISLMGVSFVVGAMCGATLAMGLLA